jgi:hypothetical protein
MEKKIKVLMFLGTVLMVLFFLRIIVLRIIVLRIAPFLSEKLMSKPPLTTFLSPKQKPPRKPHRKPLPRLPSKQQLREVMVAQEEQAAQEAKATVGKLVRATKA